MAVVQGLYHYSIQPKRKTGIFFFQDPYINIIERLFNHMPVLASTIVVRRTWYHSLPGLGYSPEPAGSR